MIPNISTYSVAAKPSMARIDVRHASSQLCVSGPNQIAVCLGTRFTQYSAVLCTVYVFRRNFNTLSPTMLATRHVCIGDISGL